MFIAPITFKLSIQASPLGRSIVINLVYKSFKIASPLLMSPWLGVIPRVVSTTVPIYINLINNTDGSVYSGIDL